jgi:hypothetical protein
VIPRRWLTVLLAVAVLIAAFVLRDSIQRIIILPLAYLWWLLKLYYRAAPQVIVWALLVVAVFASMLRLVPIKNLFDRTQKKEQKLAIGSIENFAHWISKSPRGIYYKWLVANRLGKLGREILAQRDGYIGHKKFGRLEGRGWNPPQKISDYLETGLNGSFADFPQPRWPLHWKPPKPTPLDLDLGQAIDYLENEMETTHNGNRKGI